MPQPDPSVAMASTPFLVGVILLVVVVLLGLRAAVLFTVPALVGAPQTQPAGHPSLPEAAPGRSVTGSDVRRQIAVRAAGLLCAAAMLAALFHEVRHDTGLARFDEPVDTFFSPYRSAWLLKVFLWITAIGAGPCLAAVLCCATVLLLSDRRGWLVPPLWIAFLGAQATTWSSKYIVDRPRPVFLPNITEWNPSFPSGHSTASTALIGMLGYIVARGVRRGRARFDIAFATAALIALVCFSRIFLGVHFLTDVLAGVLVGIIWLLIGTGVARLRSAAHEEV